jgi:curved DNA-binding protein CbpA
MSTATGYTGNEEEFDPYKIIGLSRDATPKDVDVAWKQLSMKHHPDRTIGQSPDEIKKSKEYFNYCS